ncbi:hypothetical protein D3C84_371240 [compost metagenome]
METHEQRALLISAGSTNQAQGFYFSEAVDSTCASELLRQGRILVRTDEEEPALAPNPPQGRA